ncbi:MAG: hypothetical protein JW986_07450 [Methanotrichaceae archaeon]|nr:hypothetical protein [Methanotrichaceae archaeon]
MKEELINELRCSVRPDHSPGGEEINAIEIAGVESLKSYFYYSECKHSYLSMNNGDPGGSITANFIRLLGSCVLTQGGSARLEASIEANDGSGSEREER